MHYTRTGGNNPPVILLHGLTANGLCWSAVANALESEYDVIMPDARGHGKSSAPTSGYHYEDHANDVVGLIETLKLSHPLLMGHSMGGMTAAVIASRNPMLLRGLVLADPTFLSPNVQRDVYESDVAEQHSKILTTPYDELVTKARNKHPKRSLDILERIAQARLQTSINAFAVLTPPNPDFRQLVCTLDIPTLLVTGATGVVTPTVAAELLPLNAKLQWAQISAAGHGLHYDQPEHFAGVVKAFLSTLEL